MKTSLHRAPMNFSPTPKRILVQSKVKMRLHNNASEVVLAAAGESLNQKSEAHWLRAQAAIGYVQLEAGESIPVKSKKAFFALVRGKNKT